jgi:hypothetical protein
MNRIGAPDDQTIMRDPFASLRGLAHRVRFSRASSTTEGQGMIPRRDIVRRGALAVLMLTAAQGAWAQEKKVNLFKIITVKDDIVIGLTADELKAIGGNDAGAVAHALAQKGDMTVWQYNVRRGPNGELQQAPTARIGLIANASLRVEPYTTPYAIVPHE